MENKMETALMGYILRLYWGNIGIMEKKMETTIMRALHSQENSCLFS